MIKEMIMSKMIFLAVLMAATSTVLGAEGDKIFGELDGQIIATGSGRVVKLDKDGNKLWSFKGANVSDVWLLPNGNVLFADNAAKEVDPKTDKIVWSYKSEFGKGGGTFGVQRLENGLTLVAENSTGRILEVDQKGAVVFEMQLPLIKRGIHGNFRHCRKLQNGNYLITHKGPKIVREYTPKGEVVQEIKVPNAAFSAVRLPNGNTIVGHIDGVTEYNKEGKAVWSFKTSELPAGITTGFLCGIHSLPNGNIVCGTYRVPLKDEKGAALFEITRKKKLVWRYFKSDGDRVMMAVQKLTPDGKSLSGETLR